jgi:hypothetical protein
MSRFCGPNARDPIGGSSQLNPLALSNPKKNDGPGATTTWFERKLDLFLGAYFMDL